MQPVQKCVFDTCQVKQPDSAALRETCPESTQRRADTVRLSPSVGGFKVKVTVKSNDMKPAVMLPNNNTLHVFMLGFKTTSGHHISNISANLTKTA